MSGVELAGVHILLTYKCLYECDHCFVWSSPASNGTMTLERLEDTVRQSRDIPSVKNVYFEGGEPFLYYPLLLKGVQLARELSLDVGIVSNAYFAVDEGAARLWLKPLAELGISDLSLSTDVHHGTGEAREMVERAKNVAETLGIPVGVIEIEGVDQISCPASRDGSIGKLCFRGRAAVTLAKKVKKRSWRSFDTCPEEPPNIGRVHIDPYGNVLFCQGVSVGNVWKRPLREIMEGLDPGRHPIIGPLTAGGPARLATDYGVTPKRGYADACHLCYDIRCELRDRGIEKDVLVPDQLYGVMPEQDLTDDVSDNEKTRPKRGPR